jgi:hypothetical protein
VRPTDENQYSTRPNLMSSGRRAGNDQSILEMLERDTGRGNRRGRRSRVAWYGAGSALAVGLIGLLAWLTHDSAPPQEAQPIAVAEVASPAARPAPTDPAAELMGLNDLDDPPRPHHAAVIDEQRARPSKPITPVAMLAPSSQAQLPPVGAGKGALVRDEAPPAAAVKKTAVTAIIHERAKAQAMRTAAEPARTRAPAKKAASTQAPSTARSSQHKLAHDAPRARKTTPAQPSRPAVDSDVALISAVIQHSSARPNGQCADASCAAKTTAQP